MNLYEIDRAMNDLIDPETGEIKDYEALVELNLARESKLENLAIWVKNLKAEEAALAAEIDNLTTRKRSTANKAERLKTYLKLMLNGDKFKTAKCAVSYRKSEKVVADDDFIRWAQTDGEQFLKYKDPEIDKMAVKEAIKNGFDLPHVHLEENNSIIIK